MSFQDPEDFSHGCRPVIRSEPKPHVIRADRKGAFPTAEIPMPPCEGCPKAGPCRSLRQTCAAYRAYLGRGWGRNATMSLRGKMLRKLKKGKE